MEEKTEIDSLKIENPAYQTHTQLLGGKLKR